MSDRSDLPVSPSERLGPSLHNGRITLVDYDPDWPRQFEEEAARVRAVLGDRVLRLDHIGSTSVPGLMAKPIIDLCLVVADSSDEPSYATDLERAGYVLQIREPGWHEHRAFKGPDRNINLHVFSEGSTEIERHLLFRDRLRAEPSERALYAQTKLELAERTWQYVQDYADAKSEVVEAVIARGRSAAGADAR